MTEAASPASSTSPVPTRPGSSRRCTRNMRGSPMSSGKTRGRSMIDFIGLYRITTIEPTRRAFAFEDLDQAEAALGQLARAGLVVEHRGKEAIGGTLAYWTLT